MSSSEILNIHKSPHASFASLILISYRFVIATHSQKNVSNYRRGGSYFWSLRSPAVISGKSPTEEMWIFRRNEIDVNHSSQGFIRTNFSSRIRTSLAPARCTSSRLLPKRWNRYSLQWASRRWQSAWLSRCNFFVKKCIHLPPRRQLFSLPPKSSCHSWQESNRRNWNFRRSEIDVNRSS